MGKKVEKFFGLQVSLARDIEPNEYEAMASSLDAALKDLEICRDNDFCVYITRIELRVSRERVFKVSSISERLRQMNIRISVHPHDKKFKRVFFLNHLVEKKAWLISPTVEVDAEKYRIKISFDGEYAKASNKIELLVMTCVDRGIPYYDRRLRVGVTAYATPQFGEMLINTGGKITSYIPYQLNSAVQFRFPCSFPPATDIPLAQRAVIEAGAEPR